MFIYSVAYQSPQPSMRPQSKESVCGKKMGLWTLVKELAHIIQLKTSTYIIASDPKTLNVP